MNKQKIVLAVIMIGESEVNLVYNNEFLDTAYGLSVSGIL